MTRHILAAGVLGTVFIASTIAEAQPKPPVVVGNGQGGAKAGSGTRSTGLSKGGAARPTGGARPDRGHSAAIEKETKASRIRGAATPALVVSPTRSAETEPSATRTADSDGALLDHRDAEQLPTIAEVLNGWGGTDPRLDLDGDGVVGGSDLAIVLAGQVGAQGETGDALGAWPSLPLGDGFAGVTAQPDAVGEAGMAGAGCDVIARWNLVPFQDAPSEFLVGVVAFHRNGIDRVEFSADGGPWIPVATPSVNPFTSTPEYAARLQAVGDSSRLVEVRARVFPNGAGVPRVLQGSFDGARVGGPRELEVRNGMHSMWVNLPGSEGHATGTVWASGDGSDESGDGSEANPFRTIARALTWLDYERGTSEGSVLMLKPGEYQWNSPSAYSAPRNKIRTSSRFLTVRSAPGVSERDVRITGSDLGGLRSALVRVSGVTFDGNAALRTPTSLDSCLWVDQCFATSADKFGNTGGWGAGGWFGIYATNCEAVDVARPFRDTTYARNCLAQSFSDTPFGSDTMIVGCRADQFFRNPNGDHADVMHWFFTKPGVRENRIVLGLTATRFELQGFQMNPITTGGQRLDNVALVNLHLSKDVSNVAGSWWMLDCDHLLIWNTQMPDQPLRWQAHSQDLDGELTLTNVSIRNSIFSSFSGVEQQGFEVANTHFLRDAYGTWLPEGEAITVGPEHGGATCDSIFRDHLNLDYRAKPGSVISSRLPVAEAMMGFRFIDIGEWSELLADGPDLCLGAFDQSLMPWAFVGEDPNE